MARAFEQQWIQILIGGNDKAVCTGARFRNLIKSTNFIITSRDNEYFISPARNQVISGCNHEKPGARLVLHGSIVDSNVAVVCKDTVVYSLMIWDIQTWT